VRSAVTLSVLVFGTPSLAAGGDMRSIPAGSYVPLYSDRGSPPVQVAAFRLDRVPVTNADFQSFLGMHPQWRRDRIKRLFADEGYLAAWTDALTPHGDPAQPVVSVSWFAARAYCEAQGKRLPLEDEWELAASASHDRPYARDRAAWSATILTWYSQRTTTPAAVGQSPPNYYGVHDLHGLVWEWVEDFNATLYGADNRQGGDGNLLRFCGAGALNAADALDYANFMRSAFRTSLQGSYTTKQLGFRCASDESDP